MAHDHQRHRKPYWLPSMDERTPMQRLLEPASRKTVYTMEAVLKHALPVAAELEQELAKKAAHQHGLEAWDLTAIKDTMVSMAQFFAAGGSLNKLDSMEEYPQHKPIESSSSPNKMLEDLSTLSQQQMTISLRKRNLQAQGYDVLREGFSGKARLNALEKKIAEPKFAYLKGDLQNAGRAVRFLRTLHGLREQSFHNIYLFRTQSMQWRLVSDEANMKDRRGKLIDIFGKFLEDYQHFPFGTNDRSDGIDTDARLIDYYITTAFPGSDNKHFRVSGSHWRKFDEYCEWITTPGRLRDCTSISDQIILSMQNYMGIPLHMHALFHRKVDDKVRLVSAVDLAPGSVLGIVPVELRFSHPSAAEPHWFEVYPEMVYFEPMPSPFTLLFEHPDTTHVYGNVVLVYERVNDCLSGLGPSFRIFAVANRHIPALEVLSI